MQTKVLRCTSVLLALFLGGTPSRPTRLQVSAHPSGQTPTLTNTCLITSNVKRLSEFYERVLQVKGHIASDQYVEFPTTAGTLAIFDAAAQEMYIPGAAQAGQNRSAILEFHVANVDQEYIRLQDFVKNWVKPPPTQPWGTRSIYFRDPDGNLVDFFSPVKP
jgi:catechol 2,3-dioxygenase-like lactoylglutathione lyase family enzyme